MNLPGISFPIEAPSRSFTFPSDLAISTSTTSSKSRSTSSCCLRYPFPTVSCSEGFVAVSLLHQLAENAGKNKGALRGASCFDNSRRFDCARSIGSGVLRSTSFKCAALGHGGDGQPEMSKVAGAESAANGNERKDHLLVSGSPVVIVEAPVMLKTAEPMPMMRPNRGQIKPGDAGRVIDRRPKDLWAVRFAVGAYLIERKCFKPIDIQ